MDLQVLLGSLDTFSYNEAFDRFSSFLEVKEQEQPERYTQYLQKFLERFPFSFLHWTKYLALRIEDLGRGYSQALEHLPKSMKLWQLYLSFIKDLGNPIVYKKELERAIAEVGADTQALFLFEEYLHLISDDTAKWEFFKKIFSKSLVGLEEVVKQFEMWIDGLSAEKLQLIYTKELRGSLQGASMSPQLLKAEMEKLYKKAIQWREKRLAIEVHLTELYFNGEDPARTEQYPYWMAYIQLLREQNVVENVCYGYENALMSQSEHVSLWQQAFHYLENDTGKYVRVLGMLRSNSQFFMHFSPQLYYYWCDLEQRENSKTARLMYIRMEQFHKQQPPSGRHLQTYLRHIQLEVRQKEWTNAKNLYDVLLVLYQNDLELLSYVLVEYSEFVVRRYKDTQYPKKLLHAYFQALPYCEYLFSNYLEFMRNFENKDGYYDQLMSIVATGLAKARKITAGDEYRRVLDLVKKHLRQSLTSIYLIKMSEKKMLDIEQKLKLDDN